MREHDAMPMKDFLRSAQAGRSMTRSTLRLLLAGTLVTMVACSGAATRPPASVTFVVVRHAEKASDDAGDPSLSEAGHASAHRLALTLAGKPVAGVYATQYRRTRQTAQPTAQAHRLPVVEYQAQLPVAALVRQLRAAHATGVVLVVGHSNTVPDIVASLSGKPVQPMSEQEYGVMYRITVGAAQGAVLERTRY